jgi:hypothetical protein
MNMGYTFKPSVTEKKHCQHLTRLHNHLKVVALRSPITQAKIPACKGVDGCPNPQLVALVTHTALQFLELSYLWDFFRFWGMAELMSGLWNERASQ